MSMPVVKRLFNSGEFSPKVYGRTDIDRYGGGVQTLLNFVPIPQGGIVRRPGTRYIATANSNNVKLIPFQFSTTQAYVIEAGNGYMRFYKDGGVILDGSNNAYTIASNYTANDVGKIQFSQSFDTLYLYHQNHAPHQLTRTAHNNWTLGAVSFNNAPTDWSNNNGYPRTGTFYQDRHVLGSPPLYPQRLYFSQTSNYTNMTTGTNDSNGFVINLLSGTADVIFSLASHKSLIALADSGVWSISAANGSTTAITPTNRRAVKDSYFGSAEVIPARLGDHVIYAQYLAGKVRDLSYSYEADGYTSSESSVLADHLIEGYSIPEMAYQQSPFEIIWMRRSDGTLLALTYLAEHKVIGWSRHTCGNVQSITCIPGTLESELWLATSRTINSNNVLYIERLDPFYFPTANNAFFIDCGLSGNTSGGNTVLGLNHLNGETVSYLADGNTSGNATVSNNSIGLAANATHVAVGIPYVSEVTTLPIEAELKTGPVMFQTKRITGLEVRCRNSAGGSFGPDSNNQTALMNNMVLFSGDITNLSLRGGYATTRTVTLRQTEPLPLNIDAIGLDLEVD